MQKLILLLALVCGHLGMAQFDLEHIYDDHMIKRVKLSVSGEKYYYFDAATVQLHFFNSDHTPWKNITLSIPSGPNIEARPINTEFLSIAETEINSDPLIEVVYKIYYLLWNGNSGTGHSASKIINESGNVLFSVTDMDIKLSHIAGLPNKLLTVSNIYSASDVSNVYSLPDFTLEHFYANGSVDRVKLEMSGETYYLLNKTTQQTEFYNSNHAYWKAVYTPKPPNAGNIYYKYDGLSVVSETAINEDSLLEFAYSYGYSTGSTYYNVIKLLNENGNILYEGMGSSFSFSRLPGFATKLIKHMYSSWAGSQALFFSVPSLTLEATYPESIVRENIDGVGEKYYYASSGNVIINNADHSIWKTFPLTIPPTYFAPSVRLNHISATVFNNDMLIDASYTYAKSIQPGGPETTEVHYQSKIINELGQEIFVLDGAMDMYVSSYDGLEDKLIADLKSYNSWNGVTIWQEGKVYDINLLLGLDEFKKTKTVVFPNPASTVLNIKAPKKITNAKIFTIIGSLVREVDSDIDQISVDGLSSGSYLLQLTDESDQTSIHKIIVAH